MAKEKALILALLIGLILLSQGVAFAQKGGNATRAAGVPSTNFGLTAIPSTPTLVGLPAGALAAPGAAQSASSAGLMPPGLVRKAELGVTPSAALVGTTSHGNSDQANGGSSAEKSEPGKEKVASASATSSGAASSREERLNQLPTCR